MTDSRFLSGQAAIVTGSTSGIGMALADALAGAGCDVVLNGFGDAVRIEAERAAMAERHGVKALYHGADMTKGDEIAAMVAYAKSELGRLDILVNNAGVQFVAPVDEFPPEKWDQIIAINLTSAFLATRAALPIMKAQQHGRIVNIASAHGLVASPFKSAYVAAKHGVVGLTKTVALEVAHQAADQPARLVVGDGGPLPGQFLGPRDRGHQVGHLVGVGVLLDQGEGGGETEAGLGLGQTDLVRAALDKLVDHLDWHGASLADRNRGVNLNRLDGDRAHSAVQPPSIDRAAPFTEAPASDTR